ncbi:hypothetical protein QKD39_gp05 [Psittacine adenovirus 1]|uniref:Uncharacterized protein n=1 Tax=Psittacine adenovirus 1 TaxID=318592 RepID=A0A2Z5E0A9_9ADEN|nr:hypothetical protein QKD39_gp05 [Psittacine adenovirus 1]AXB73039.1 hypothetical protein [Psittacine adenovirus 1]
MRNWISPSQLTDRERTENGGSRRLERILDLKLSNQKRRNQHYPKTRNKTLH